MCYRKILIVQFSPTSCQFLPVRSKQFPQQPVFKHPLSMSMSVFWVATPCGLVDRHRRLGGTYCFHLQGGIWRHMFLRNVGISASPHSVTIQKTNIDIFTTVISHPQPILSPEDERLIFTPADFKTNQ
jgi:hypothetical protein